MKVGAFFFGGVEMSDAGVGAPAPMDRRFTNEQMWEATQQYVDAAIEADRFRAYIESPVLTGIAVVRGARVERAIQVSRVRFARLSDADIDAYVATGEPRGKAGAYAIQGRAAAFVRRIEGSHSGIMGLPLYEASTLLRRELLALSTPQATRPPVETR